MSGRQETVYLDLSWWLAQYRIKKRACHCKVKLPIQACSMGHASLLISKIVFIKKKKVWKQKIFWFSIISDKKWDETPFPSKLQHSGIFDTLVFGYSTLTHHSWAAEHVPCDPLPQNTSTTSLLHTPIPRPHLPYLFYSLNRSPSPTNSGAGAGVVTSCLAGCEILQSHPASSNWEGNHWGHISALPLAGALIKFNCSCGDWFFLYNLEEPFVPAVSTPSNF